MDSYESYLRYFLSQKTRGDLRIDAGKDLSDKIIGLFTSHGSREGVHAAVEWFYTPLRTLSGYSLADLCDNDMRWLAERIVDSVSAKVNNPVSNRECRNMKTLDDLRKDAGEDLAKLITSIVQEKEAIEWFYNCKVPSPEFHNKTPFEYIKENGTEGAKYIYSRLMNISVGGGES